MQFTTLHRWKFLKREKRFFIYGTENGQPTPLTAHCANTGSLRGVLENTTHVWVSKSNNPNRKLPFSAELCELKDGTLVNINTAHANTLAAEAIQSGHICVAPCEAPGEAHRDETTERSRANTSFKNLPLQSEVKFSPETRFDFKAGETWIEVKNTTYAEKSIAMFPDAVTERGLKHLQTLTQIVQNGGQATQIYIISRPDCTHFTPAQHIDPAYATALKNAHAAGVHLIALSCHINPHAITVDKPLPIML